MARLSLIPMVKLLRARGWAVDAAVRLARTVDTLQQAGTLPPGDAAIVPDGAGEPVTVRELETAGGVTRLEFVPVI